MVVILWLCAVLAVVQRPNPAVMAKIIPTFIYISRPEPSSFRRAHTAWLNCCTFERQSCLQTQNKNHIFIVVRKTSNRGVFPKHEFSALIFISYLKLSKTHISEESQSLGNGTRVSWTPASSTFFSAFPLWTFSLFLSLVRLIFIQQSSEGQTGMRKDYSTNSHNKLD